MGRQKEGKRRRKIQAYEQLHGPDTAEIVHRFDDSWTVRRLVYMRDAFYEGTMMGHCLDPRNMPEEAKAESNLIAHTEGWDILSLRDPINHPRVTFGISLDGELQNVHTLGFPKGQTDPSFQARLDAFVEIWRNPFV